MKKNKMKKTIYKDRFFLFLISFLILSSHMNAQVTIGSDEAPIEGSLLQLKDKVGVVDSKANASKGLNLPRVNLSDENNLFPMFLSNPNVSTSGANADYVTNKATIDKTHVALTVYNVNGTDPFSQGIYTWDGLKWQKTGSGGAPVLIPTEPWLVSGSSAEATSNTENIYQMGQVTIGASTSIDATAALNVVANNKGVLLPRVTLKSPTDNTTIPNPTTGLLVYNTGSESTFSTTGYMFWDGSSWKIFANASSESAKATLNCAGAQMSPGQQIIEGTSIIAGTVLQIPYTGSNGGSFNGATLVSTDNPNVTATISGGMLSVGNGMLNFALSGTPTIAQQAPAGVTFDVAPFLTNNPDITGCTDVTVGNVLTAAIEETAAMGYLMLVTDNTGNDQNTQYYALQCNSPDGKFSIRAGVPVTQTSVVHGNQTLNVQVRNNQTTTVPVVWNFNTDYGGSLSTSGVLAIPSQRWGGDQDSGNIWTNASGNDTNNGAFWGQVGIYDAENSGPEYRRYTWIPQGAESKIAYEATIMVALDTITPTKAVHPTKIKCYIKFSQVTAQ